MDHLGRARMIDCIVPVVLRSISTAFICWLMHLHNSIVAISITKATSENGPVAISSYISIGPQLFCSIMQAVRYSFIRRLTINAWLFRRQAEICLYIFPVVLTIVQLLV